MNVLLFIICILIIAVALNSWKCKCKRNSVEGIGIVTGKFGKTSKGGSVTKRPAIQPTPPVQMNFQDFGSQDFGGDFGGQDFGGDFGGQDFDF